MISRRAVKLRKRVAGVRVSCRSPAAAAGTLVLKQRTVVARARQAQGQARSRSASASSTTRRKRRNAVLRVKLTRKGARAVEQRSGASASPAVASVRFGDGTRAKPSRKFWLYRPSGGRR